MFFSTVNRILGYNVVGAVPLDALSTEEKQSMMKEMDENENKYATQRLSLTPQDHLVCMKWDNIGELDLRWLETAANASIPWFKPVIVDGVLKGADWVLALFINFTTNRTD